MYLHLFISSSLNPYKYISLEKQYIFNLKIIVFMFGTLFYFYLISLQYICVYFYILLLTILFAPPVPGSLFYKFHFVPLWGSFFIIIIIIPFHLTLFICLVITHSFTCYPRCYKMNPWIIEVNIEILYFPGP